jgi:hypothetical protein
MGNKPECIIEYERLSQEYFEKYPNGRIQSRPFKGRKEEHGDRRFPWIYVQVSHQELDSNYNYLEDPDNHFEYREDLTQLAWQRDSYYYKGKCAYYLCNEPVELGIFYCEPCAAANMMRLSLFSKMLERGNVKSELFQGLKNLAQDSPMYKEEVETEIEELERYLVD